MGNFVLLYFIFNLYIQTCKERHALLVNKCEGSCWNSGWLITIVKKIKIAIKLSKTDKYRLVYLEDSEEWGKRVIFEFRRLFYIWINKNNIRAGKKV